MIKDWCVVGRKMLTGSVGSSHEVMMWAVEHYNEVMFYNEIYYDFNEDEAHAMCKLLNEGEAK